jgi:glycosyltransferase involved in cell wall biosynthesis
VKKGLRELVEAAASLRKQRTNLHVYLIGDEGPDRLLIESAVLANNAGSYIHVLPGCSFDRCRRLDGCGGSCYIAELHGRLPQRGA